MKYVDHTIVFSEIPNEVTLAINISECPIKCPDCHSKYLWDNTGSELTHDVLDNLIKENDGITCVCIMGGDRYPDDVGESLKYIRSNHPDLKTAWYSGYDLNKLDIPFDLSLLDYLKTGPYIKERGPLTSKTTNQRFYSITKIYGKNFLIDETGKFHRVKQRE